jgi:hypothetical protein
MVTKWLQSGSGSKRQFERDQFPRAEKKANIIRIGALSSAGKGERNSSGGGSARQQGRHRQSIAILGNSVTQIAKRVLLLNAASLGDGQQSSGG